MIGRLGNLHARFIDGHTQDGRLVNGAIGENPVADSREVPLDDIRRFGAQTQFQPNVKEQFRQYPFAKYPWTLHASNKASEHNIFNSWPVIVVGQLAGQTTPPDLSRIVSRRIRLPQSMQGGA